MVTKSLILATLLKLPQWHLDTISYEDRVKLLTPLAEVISSEAKTVDEAAALTAHTSKETNFAVLVLTGRCNEMPKGIDCDAGKARGPFQVHKHCVEAWRHTDGSIESYREGARCALRILRRGLKSCGNWTGAFAAMRGMPVCTSARAPAYVAQQQQVLTWWKTGVVRAESNEIQKTE